MHSFKYIMDKRHKQAIHERKIPMVSDHMKRCSISLAITEMQMKTQ